MLLIRLPVLAAGVALALSSASAAQRPAAAPHPAAAPRAAAAKPAAPARPAASSRAAIESRVKDPYLGAIAIDAETGKVLFEDNADAKGYPASVIKMMDMLILQEKIEKGELKLTDIVAVTAEAARMGGSQVHLDVRESFPVEELIYALMIQSANDAAVALAIRAAGTTSAFVALMNSKAAELGMTSTEFHSVHGLPPSAGGSPDVSTPRDLSKLALEILKHPDILRYTSTRKRQFRGDPKPTILETHDHLLGVVEGCDGMKTGWIQAGGYSMIATALRNGRRVVVVVMGSPKRAVRDGKIKELMESGFSALPPKPVAHASKEAPAQPVQAVEKSHTSSTPAVPPAAARHKSKKKFVLIGLGVAVLVIVAARLLRRRPDDGLSL